jgi:hypothetical protein
MAREARARVAASAGLFEPEEAERSQPTQPIDPIHTRLAIT